MVLSPVTASEFSVDGGAAIIPAGTESTLSSYGSQPELQFGLSSSDITSATSFSVTLADNNFTYC